MGPVQQKPCTHHLSNGLKKGILNVLIANIINLGFSLITGFVLPKILSIDTYASIKTYQLYISYVAVAQLGYMDGMYLKYGGKKLREIEPRDLNTNLSTIRIFTCIAAVILGIVGVVLGDPIFFAFALSEIPLNMTGYYKQLYQATGEFKNYGHILNMSTIGIFVFNMILIFVVRTDYYLLYLGAYVVVYIGIWLALESNFQKNNRVKQKLFCFSFNELIENICGGFLLLCGNLSSVLMTGMDRWFVKFTLETAAFAEYAFAVSMETFLNVAVTPVTTTLYNYFCTEKSEGSVRKIRNYVMIFGSSLVACAFPVKFIINLFLDKYNGAVDVIFLLFASQIFYIVIKSVFVNLYKAERRQKTYFIKLVSVLVFGFLANVICFMIYPQKESYAVGTLLSAIYWYIISAVDFKWIKYSLQEISYLFIQCFAFIFCGFTLSAVLGFFVYVIFTVVITFVLMRKEFCSLYRDAYKFIVVILHKKTRR